VDRYSYTDRTAQLWHFTFTLHCVGIGVKGDKKAGENSGHLGKMFCPLFEEKKHLILGGQISTCVKLPPF